MRKLKIDATHFSLFITIVLFVILWAVGSFKYNNFFSLQVFCNLLIDNAHLIILTVGMTFVLIIGGSGIDISVGSVIALVCMASAWLTNFTSLNAFAIMGLMVLMGAVFGFIQGCLITYLKMQPFIVTLAGLMLARGLTALISENSITISNPIYVSIASAKIHIFGTDAFVRSGVLIAIVILFIAWFILSYTRLGRNIYAIGGNEQSAVLMGLPVNGTKVAVYTLSGICAALAGIVFSLYMLSGFVLHGQGMEMDAIASAVIGGTTLTGGVGGVVGAFFGVLINGTIKTLIMFQGTLSSWWTRIVMAALLCVFIVIQRIISMKNISVDNKNTKKIKKGVLGSTKEL
jgi:galactofuranose transport system permease protein